MGEFIHVLPVQDGLYDLVRVLFRQYVTGLFLLEFLRCVHEEDTPVLIVLLKEDQADRDARRIEEFRRQAYDGVDATVFDEVPADGPFRLSAEEDAQGHDDAHHTVFPEMIETMEQEGVVGLSLGGQLFVGRKAGIFQHTLRGGPACTIRRVHGHAMEGRRFVRRPVGIQRIAAAEVLVLVGDLMKQAVHPRQAVGASVLFLAEVVHMVSDPLIQVVLDVQ